MAGIFVQRIELGRMGWKCDGRLKSRQELGHGGAGIGTPCHGVWAYSEGSENLLTVSKKNDQVRPASAQYEKVMCCSGGMRWMVQNQKQNPIRWPCQ